MPTQEDFRVTMPLKVDWSVFDKSLMPKYWSSSPERINQVRGLLGLAGPGRLPTGAAHACRTSHRSG
jgi:hypothetical protein